MGIEKWTTMCLCMTTALLIVVQNANGFLPTSKTTTTLSSPSRILLLPFTPSSTTTSTSFGRHLVAVEAEKKKRRRKQAPGDPTTSEAAEPPPVEQQQVIVKPPPPPEPTPAVVVVPAVVEPMSSAKAAAAAAAAAAQAESFKSILLDAKEFDDDAAASTTESSLSDLLQVAKFKFVPENDFTKGVKDDETVTSSSEMMMPGEDGAIPLPDIKQVLRRKEIEKELERMEEEKESQKVKINRNDKKAMARLLEQQPYADADASYFEDEEYTTVSALLGERAAPFLGIPSGPLQVGHFIGSLVIVLMAFVEYPGFPLTNLPTPLRGALQGGLGTVYLINTVLAVLAVFKAGERGQPAVLWVAKTFSVGGLAYDQLTQLPTLEETTRAKAVKGKRALKNQKK